MNFLTDLFSGRSNPAGTGNAATFDGAPALYSFYVNTHYIEPAEGPAIHAGAGWDEPNRVRRSWRRAIDAGHEIGVHTHSHPHGRDLTVAQWQAEMKLCTTILERPFATGEAAARHPAGVGLGVAHAELTGFRTPYLEYSDDTLTAIQRQGFSYDCSLEEGTRPDQDGTDFVWPYRLDAGSPGNPEIGSHPGLWEIPVYVFIVPPDAACQRLGVAPGLRRALKQRRDYFDIDTAKITGMDWNLWCEFAMTPAEFLATVRYTLELRLVGNRAPLTIGLHSELYSDLVATECASPVADRRKAVAALLDHVLSIDDVRVITTRDLLSWLQRPVPLR